MSRRLGLIIVVLAALAPLAGCAGKSLINAYLLEDANVGGVPDKSIKPIKSVLVWPLENISAGSKSKGVETRFSGVLADTLTLRSGFEKVVILEEDQAKDLMARAGEELGLKKKPKAPADGALIATKLGQLTGTETILIGRLEDYDEDKVDKATLSVVSASFNLLDAREKAYAAIDSFTPVKRVWRSHVKRASKEGPFNSRESLDDDARTVLRDVVDRMTADLGQGASVSGKAQEKRLAELNAAAQKSLDAGELDKASTGFNEMLKIQPENKKAKKGLAEIEKRKRQAEEREKAAALKKQVDEIRAKALEADKAGNLDAALAEWKKIRELDKKDGQAADRISAIEKQVKKAQEEAEKKAAAEKKAKEEAEKKAAAEKKAKEEAEKKAGESKPASAPAAAPAPKSEVAPAPAPEKKAEEKPAEAPAPKAEEKPAEAPAPKAEEKPAEAPAPKAEEKPAAAPAPKAEEKPAAAPAPKAEEKPAAAPAKAEEKPAAAAAPAGGGELDALRNQAMAAFNKEDYQASRDLWKKILEKVPDDKQAKEMLETTEMLLNALK